MLENLAKVAMRLFILAERAKRFFDAFLTTGFVVTIIGRAT